MRNIKIHSAVVVGVLQQPALFPSAFLWCLARLLDEKGRGWVWKQELLHGCPAWQGVMEAARRELADIARRELTDAAETPFWVMDRKRQRLFLKSNRKVLLGLLGYPLRLPKTYHLITLSNLSSLEVFQQTLRKMV